jgi:hypothetical protein
MNMDTTTAINTATMMGKTSMSLEPICMS